MFLSGTRNTNHNMWILETQINHTTERQRKDSAETRDKWSFIP